MTASSPLSVPSSTSSRESVRRWGVVGLGRAGLQYAMAIAQAPDCELAGFIESDATLRGFARGAGFAAPASATLARLLVKTPLDAVVICARPEERVALIEQALAGGLAVLCDGLPAPSAEGAARLAALPAATGPRFACGAAVLVHPLFADAARLLAAGVIGEPGRVRASVYVSRVFSAGAPPADGDVLDLSVAELAVLMDALFGAPRRVRATGHRLYGTRLDELHAELELPSGIEAGVDGSWSVPGYPRAAIVVEVEGVGGRLIVSDDALEIELVSAAAGLPAGVTRRVLADEPDPVAFEAGDASRLLGAFVAQLAGGPVVPALDAARSLRAARLVAAMRRSAGANGAVQELGA